MRLGFIFAVVVVLAGLSPAAVSRRTHPAKHLHPYRKHWKHETLSKKPLARVTAGAGINQLRHHPRQLGGGAAGFGKRAGAGFATGAVASTVEHAVAAPLHESLHYRRSRKRRFGPRLRHALVSTVVTRNTRTGKRTPAAGRISGHAAAGAVSQAVIPGAVGASTAGIGLAADAGANVAREFAPRRKHRHAHRRKPA